VFANQVITEKTAKKPMIALLALIYYLVKMGEHQLGKLEDVHANV